MWLTVSNLAKSFGERRLFADVSFTAGPGRCTTIIGPSGSGKTTLLAILAGLERPNAGTVIWHQAGRPAAQPCPATIVWVPQSSPVLVARSARANVAVAALANGLGPAAAAAKADDALRLVGLEALADHAAGALSGGERQRLGFARAAASGQSVLLADEPTANLDQANTELVRDALTALAVERTVVVATHDPALLTSAGLVVELRPVTEPLQPRGGR